MKSRLVWIVGLVLMSVVGYSQTLQEQYDDMITRSSTWEGHKVIKIEVINEFWNQVDQKVKSDAATVADLKSKIKALERTIDTLQSSISTVKMDLRSSQEINESIQFLGMDMVKSTYHLLVWAIIVILGALAVFAYVLYANSNSVTSRIKKDYSHLSQEFELQKDKAREAQVKLKRELQTAVNTIEDLKRGGSSRRV